MLFKLTGTDDLSKDDIENLKAHGFNIEYKKIDEQEESLYNASFRKIEYYNMFIDVLTINDLLTICNILRSELIITKSSNSKEYDWLEVYNGYRE